MATGSFDYNAALWQLGITLTRYERVWTRVHENSDYTRVVVAGLIWEGPQLPPRYFFGRLRRRGLIRIRSRGEGWDYIKPTKRYLDLVREETCP